MVLPKKKESSAAKIPHQGHRQRLKDRFLKNGLDALNGHEVLELLLFYALPYRDTNGLGHLLEQDFGSLVNVLDANYADLVNVDGVTPHVATLLTLCGQIAHRYQKEKYELGDQLYNTTRVGRYVLPFFFGKKEESVMLISMDNRRKVLNATRVFEGSVNSARFNFRTAVQQALRDNATTVVLAHNHPNGFAIPSQADIATTHNFMQVLKLMDIQLVDHLVVAEDDFVSMADSKETAFMFTTTHPEALATAQEQKVADTHR